MSRTSLIEAILARLAQGDPTAPAELLALAYLDVKARVRRHLAGDFERLGKVVSPTDVTHDVAVEFTEDAAKHVRTFRSAKQFFAFVNTMVYRRLLDLSRKHRASRQPGNLPEDVGTTPSYDTIPEHVLEALTGDEHQILYFWLDGLSADAMAAELGIDRSNAYRRIHALRTRLADLLGD